jgi:hypothetical protein
MGPGSDSSDPAKSLTSIISLARSPHSLFQSRSLFPTPPRICFFADKTPDQIRKTFNIRGDCGTPEEEEEIRQMHRDLLM